jgi:MFS family permease
MTGLPVIVIACAGLVLFISIGFRQTFGLFLSPMEADLGWGRESFGFAIAMQNLVWGVSQPFVGALADRFGSGRVVAGGALIYMLGLAGMASADSVLMFTLSSGLLIGLALSGTGFAVVLGAVARVVPAKRRGFMMTVTGTVGGFGQLLMIPFAQGLIGGFGWIVAFLVLAATAALIIPLAAALTGKATENDADRVTEQSIHEALVEARQHDSYWFLNMGFFVCGFHIAFILTHLPAYIADEGYSGNMGALVLIVIGVFNIPGALILGKLADHYPKRSVLSILYVVRAGLLVTFILLPTTPVTIILFGAGMGATWLATIPLTNALVAQMFGVRYVATLFGIAWFIHQLGSFFGAWIGGLVFDLTGSYDLVWWAAAWMGITAALLHLPIDERQIPRTVLGE